MPLHLPFPRSAKLRTKFQYTAVREQGRTKRGSLFRLSALNIGSLAEKNQLTQCGFIVSRRVGNAVVRNRVKRRLRELYRQERPLVPPDLWLVFVATPQAANATFAQLREEWHYLAKKLSLLSN
ncbi:MAG: ribonuclease P protein component [Chthoniobacterales bacterium]